MSNLFIGVKRVVAVDSSEFAYAELEVDAHCMLVAQGNVGKSSLINAIRLFFLPECSMAKQAVNFGFADSNGDMYKSETTFNHYFPSKYSFLILEYEKRVYDGAHCCQILSLNACLRSLVTHNLDTYFGNKEMIPTVLAKESVNSVSKTFMNT
jgi:hypothetical protein